MFAYVVSDLDGRDLVYPERVYTVGEDLIGPAASQRYPVPWSDDFLYAYRKPSYVAHTLPEGWRLFSVSGYRLLGGFEEGNIRQHEWGFHTLTVVEELPWTQIFPDNVRDSFAAYWIKGIPPGVVKRFTDLFDTRSRLRIGSIDRALALEGVQRGIETHASHYGRTRLQLALARCYNDRVARSIASDLETLPKQSRFWIGWAIRYFAKLSITARIVADTVCIRTADDSCANVYQNATQVWSYLTNDETRSWSFV